MFIHMIQIGRLIREGSSQAKRYTMCIYERVNFEVFPFNSLSKLKEIEDVNKIHLNIILNSP